MWRVSFCDNIDHLSANAYYIVDMTPWSLRMADNSGLVEIMKFFWIFYEGTWNPLQIGIQYFAIWLI